MTSPSFQQIPLEQLLVSTTEAQCLRRESFDQASLHELAESISKSGLLQPLVVRRAPDSPLAHNKDSRYEIVAGERRYLAASIAKMDTVDCKVLELNNEEVLEIQLTENLQREDLDALVEADGYRTLRDDYGLDVEAIADRVGKSESYIYKRLELNNLAAPARKALAKGDILLGVALLLARIPDPKRQSEALDEMVDFPGELKKVSEAREIIETEYMLNLADARFDTTDAELTEAPACNVCPKNTAAQSELFDDIKGKARCTDQVCYRKKSIAHSSVLLEQAKADGAAVIEGKKGKTFAPNGVHREGVKDGLIRIDYSHNQALGFDSPQKICNKKELASLERTFVMDGEGMVGEYVNLKAVKKILDAKRKAKGPTVAEEQAKAHREEQKKEKEKKQREEQFRAYLGDQIRAYVEAEAEAVIYEFFPPFLKYVVTERAWSSAETVCERLQLDITDKGFDCYEKALHKHIDSAIEGDVVDVGLLLAVAVEFMFCDDLQVTRSTDDGDAIKALAKLCEFDLRQIRADCRRHQAELKAIEKAQAAADE